MKHGELYKVGKKSGMQVSRYYILRDNALYIYKNREQIFPSNVISLRGLYINKFPPVEESTKEKRSISQEKPKKEKKTD
jgi:hypothetical protein